MGFDLKFRVGLSTLIDFSDLAKLFPLFGFTSGLAYGSTAGFCSFFEFLFPLLFETYLFDWFFCSIFYNSFLEPFFALFFYVSSFFAGLDLLFSVCFGLLFSACFGLLLLISFFSYYFDLPFWAFFFDCLPSFKS